MRLIVIVQSGFVFTGTVNFLPPPGETLKLENAACIRVWGTTAGLGELALHGPQKATVLDPIGVIHIPHHAILGCIECVESAKWTKRAA